jgi:hypothetical protein
VGFVVDGAAFLIAATEPDANWALNLLADPRCRVTLEERSFEAVARPIEGPARSRAVTALILKYGTPAERLGRGPVFRVSREANA